MKKNDGFTLLEVIIAIAALSACSVFILQIFMSSATLNARAKNADIALTKAISEIENFKTYESLSQYISTNDNASGDSDAAEMLLYYDKDWNPLGSGAQAEIRFYLKMNISSIDSQAYGALYDVSTSVYDLSDKNNERQLVSLQTKKYFAIPFGQRGE